MGFSQISRQSPCSERGKRFRNHPLQSSFPSFAFVEIPFMTASLRGLWLNGTLKGLLNLTQLRVLSAQHISDVGLNHLSAMTNLNVLSLQGSQNHSYAALMPVPDRGCTCLSPGIRRFSRKGSQRSQRTFPQWARIGEGRIHSREFA